MMVVGIRCILSNMSSKTSHLLLGYLPEQCNAESWPPLWHAIAESLTCLALRQTPEKKSIRRAIVVSIYGDLGWDGSCNSSGGEARVSIFVLRL